MGAGERDLVPAVAFPGEISAENAIGPLIAPGVVRRVVIIAVLEGIIGSRRDGARCQRCFDLDIGGELHLWCTRQCIAVVCERRPDLRVEFNRSEEHTSELQSLMRISYAVFCLKKKN